MATETKTRPRKPQKEQIKDLTPEEELNAKVEELAKMGQEVLDHVNQIEEDDRKILMETAEGDALGVLSQIGEILGEDEILEQEVKKHEEKNEDKELVRDRVRRYAEFVGRKTVDVVKAPTPMTKKQLAVAGTWYLLGAVTPVGRPAQLALMFLRGA